MKRKRFKNIKMLLIDPKHWLGWIITTGSVIGLMHLLKIHAIHSSIFNIVMLLLVIVGVDIIKHELKLQ